MTAVERSSLGVGWRDLWPEDRPVRAATRPELPCQQALLDDWQSVLAENQGHHLLAHAPTGLGKTAAALAPALAWLANRPRGRILYLVNRIAQHDNPMRELRAGLAERFERAAGRPLRVVDLIGRAQLCAEPAGLHLSDACRVSRDEADFARLPGRVASWREVRDHLPPGLCPYHTLQGLLGQADLVIGDYWWLYSPEAIEGKVDRLLDPTVPTVAIVDEAHNLPSRIRAELEVDEGFAALFAGLEGASANARACLLPVLEALQSSSPDRGLAPSQLLPLAGGEGAVALALNPLDRAAPARRLLRLLLRPDAEVVLHPTPSGDGIRCVARLVDPTGQMEAGHRRVASTLCMSGSLAAPADDGEELAYQSLLLGLPVANTLVRKYASPFPPRNRRWIYCPDTLGTYSQRIHHYPRYAAHLTAIGRATPGATAVFFSSYDFLEQVYRQMPEAERPLIVREGSGDAPAGLDGYRGPLDELVCRQRRAYLFAVFQGKIAEGADFPDNLLKTIVCVSLPLERPLLFHQRLQQHYERTFAAVARSLGDDPRTKAREYAVERLSLSLVLQACGRGIRRPADRCAFVLLDRRYGEDEGLDWRRFLDPSPFNTARPDHSVRTFHLPEPPGAHGAWDPALLAAVGRRRP